MIFYTKDTHKNICVSKFIAFSLTNYDIEIRQIMFFLMIDTRFYIKHADKNISMPQLMSSSLTYYDIKKTKNYVFSQNTYHINYENCK